MTQIATSPVETSTPAAHAAGAPVRLNDFQLLMRGWAQLGAYNAGQAMQVTGKPELERWQGAVEASVREVGLGIPHFGPGRFEVHFTPVDTIPVARVHGPFETFISQEINRRFEPTDLPIRFWVLPREDGTHYFGAFYDHWIADSRAMRDLMHRIFVRYRTPERPPHLPPLTMQAPPFRGLFRKHLGPSKLWSAAREGIRNLRRHVFVYRVNLADPLNFTSRCIYVDLPPGLITKIHRHAKAHGASVNDAFLAVLGRVMGHYTAGDRYGRKRHGRRRNRISLGTIVDIRDAAAKPLDNIFSLYLSSYVTILKEPEKMPPAQLLELIGKATRKVKRTFGTVRAYSGLEVARFWWDTYGGAKWKAQMFHKNVPVAAGTSNVNLTGSWIDQRPTDAAGGPIVLDYIRISPTGPLLPLVFTLTTIQERMSVCVTYRTTAFTPEQAATLAQRFVQGLQEAVQ